MATSNVPGGMDHPTVVPANFASVEGGADTGEESGRTTDGATFGGDDADSTVPGANPR